MRFKTTLALVALLIILGLIAYLFEGSQVTEKQEALKRGMLFPQFKSEEVKKIELKTKERNVILAKKENKWFVTLNDNYYPADTDGVMNVFETVKGMMKENVVSTDPAKYPVFELDQENGVEVKLSKADNSVLAHFCREERT